MIFVGEIHRLHKPRKNDVRIAVNFFSLEKKTKENIRNNTALPMCHDDGKNIQIVSDKVDVDLTERMVHVFLLQRVGGNHHQQVIMIYVMYNMFDS